MKNKEMKELFFVKKTPAKEEIDLSKAPNLSHKELDRLLKASKKSSKRKATKSKKAL